MDKPIIYTHHALVAMTERGLDKQWVEQVVRDPQWIELDTIDAEVVRRFRVIPERDNRYLRVACVETAENIRIVSAFLDRRARPK